MPPPTKPSSVTKRSTRTYRRLALAWALLIALLCGIPGKQLPSNHWFDLVSLDKWVHAFLFYVLCLLLYKGYRKQEGKASRWPFLLIAVAYGVLMEVLQATVFVDRTFDYQDMVANSAGACIAFIWIGRSQTASK